MIVSRSERLLKLIEILRRYRRAVTSETLAEVLGISLRTLYRDINSLRLQGADIQGEAGIGYVLRPGFMLPPLMFSQEEIEALVLGSRWVAQNGDPELSNSARDALSKIASVLPDDLRDHLDAAGLLVGPKKPVHHTGNNFLPAIRAAIRGEHIIAFDYVDAAGASTRRVVWPIALAFFDYSRMLVAWCELRLGFRHFRIDRMHAVDCPGKRYPRRRRVLMAEWRAIENVKEQ